MKPASKIVVVDDEVEIRDMLHDYLHLHGMNVMTADGGENLRRIIDEESIDLVLLDISMPGEDGLSLARYLREHTQVGIIMLTSRGDLVDRIIGIEIGADDYLVKPVDLRELLARVSAVLRRYRMSIEASNDDAHGDRVAFGDCTLDIDTEQLLDAAGEPIKITAMEFDLLKAFARHPGQVLSRDQLLDLAHNRDWDPYDRSIDIRIARLRRKIERDPTNPKIIKTVHGAGYRFSMK